MRCVALLCVLIGASPAAAQSLILQTGQFVQRSNDPVPGLPPGTVISSTFSFSLPAVDLDGNLLWLATLTGGTTTPGVDDRALFFGRTASDLGVVAQTGVAEPSGTMPGITAEYGIGLAWDGARISPQNQWILLTTRLAGPGVTLQDDSAVYLGHPGSPFLVVARENGPAPASTGGATLGDLERSTLDTAVNSGGTVVFKSTLRGGNVVAGVSAFAWFHGDPFAGLQIMCRTADPVAGFQVATSLDVRPLIDELGRVLFPQPLRIGSGIPAVTAADDAAILLFTPGSGLSIVMREGDPAPGSGGCQYDSITSTTGFPTSGFSRTTGRFAFQCNVKGGDVVGASNSGCVFAGRIGTGIVRVARETEPAPTGVAGEVYAALFANGLTQINDAGTVVFAAQLANPANPGAITPFNDTAIFLARPPYGPGDVEMILREGATNPISGLPSTWVVGNFQGTGLRADSTANTRLQLNERDVVLINVSGVRDPALGIGTPAQIAWDRDHGLRCVHVGGDIYSAPGQLLPLLGFEYQTSGSGDGCNQSFSNNGDQAARMLTSPSGQAIVRNHVGSLDCGPSSISTLTGGVMTMRLDAGPGHAGRLFAVAATASGTRPGFLLGNALVPLNPDALLTESINALSFGGTPPWSPTLGFLDGAGRATVTVTVPPNVPQIAGIMVHHAFVALDLALVVHHVSEPCGMRAF